MREIIFRGKCQSGKWVYGDYHFRESAIACNVNRNKFYVDRNTVGQYTGLKDFNGKEIYEGDIVSAQFTEDEDFDAIIVQWNEKCASFTFKGQSQVLNLDQSSIDFLGVNIIGNIYDNPELIKKEIQQ